MSVQENIEQQRSAALEDSPYRRDSWVGDETDRPRGHDPAEFDGFLSDSEIEAVTDSDTGKVHLWGTTVDSKWQFVEGGDIAMVYRNGQYIAQATVVRTRDHLDLAEQLWRTEGSPWDPESPWRFLVFLAGVEEIDVDVESFNALAGYKENYIPQGFSRVSDSRIRSIEGSHESVETAINELTGEGVRVREFDEEPVQENPDEEGEPALGERIITASRDGDQYEMLEELVAKAFSRLGFDAR
jgi:hypothetical protein